MDQLIAKPNLLKQVNLSHIRRVLTAKKTSTRSEIAKETGISSTTVRSLLYELIQNGEVQSIGYDKSSGGRKAERYTLCGNRYYGAVFCFMGHQLHALLVNLLGEIVETTELVVEDEQYEQAILPFLDQLVKEREIKAIGLGIPGIVEGGAYWKKPVDGDELYKKEIGDSLTTRYGIPVVMENDINATAIGFGRCYEKTFTGENSECINMAYLHFEEGCVSAGFLVGGRIVRGYRHFAGELGLVPIEEGKLLDAVMREAMDDAQYVKWIVQILSWICAILNPEYIALGGPALRKHCISEMGDLLFSMVPNNMYAELLYSPDVWNDYHNGMAHLTARKIYDAIQLVKEESC